MLPKSLKEKIGLDSLKDKIESQEVKQDNGTPNEEKKTKVATKVKKK